MPCVRSHSSATPIRSLMCRSWVMCVEQHLDENEKGQGWLSSFVWRLIIHELSNNPYVGENMDWLADEELSTDGIMAYSAPEEQTR